jgi:alginate O-acetyltransferase complex protein AlgI
MRLVLTPLTLVITLFSCIIFKFTDLGALGQAIANIFVSNGKGFSDLQTALTFKNNVFFLIVTVLACTPIVPCLSKLFDKSLVSRRIWAVASAIMPVILIAVSSFALAGDSFNPFLYFQF